MKRFFTGCAVMLALAGFAGEDPTWKSVVNKGFTLHYTKTDDGNYKAVEGYLEQGMKITAAFFGKDFLQKFDVYIYPDRHALDEQWKQTWNDTAFRSQCWMVASGVAKRIDLLSLSRWKKEACEHNASDGSSMQKLIAHELVHVYHGQYNPTGDFTGMDDIGWLVEGLATYASGQLDSQRMKQVKTLEEKNELPSALENICTGRDRYALAGSLAQYLDKTYGRSRLLALLAITNKQKALELLESNEADLINKWKAYIKGL